MAIFTLRQKDQIVIASELDSMTLGVTFQSYFPAHVECSMKGSFWDGSQLEAEMVLKDTTHHTHIYNSRTRMVTNSMSAASAFFGTTSVLNEDRMFEGKTPTAF